MKDKRDGIDVEPDRRALRIMEALSGVDEVLLARSEMKNKIIDYKSQKKRHRRKTDRKRTSLWRYSKTWAAVLCLAVVGTVSWGGYQLTRTVIGNDASSSGETTNLQSMALEKEVYDAGGVEMAEAQGEGNVQEPNQADSNGAAADVGGTDGVGMATDLTAEPAEKYQEAEKEQAVSEAKQDSDVGGPYEKILTEEDARAVEKLGDYMPTALPKGYVFEYAFRDQNTEEAEMSVYWSRGMDYISLNIMEVKEKPVTMDVNRPETYDRNLYEIPYAESVPEEYREMFDDPVFALEDFSLDTVKSRMISGEDSGDTDTPRGSFSVLYPDGVAVRFNGRGTAEEIWELFDSIRPE